MKFLLVILILYNTPIMNTIEFNNKADCETAKQEVIKHFDNTYIFLDAVCVEK